MAKTKDLFGGEDFKTDLSPMIDLVFLLLIFFMVTANMVTFKKDPRVVVPVASDAKVPELVEGRIVMNVLQDGTIVDTEGRVFSESDLTQRMSQAKAKNDKTRLHLRADARVPYKHIKTASRASAAGGVPTVIFSTHVVQ
ncbi:MAG: biopolymer transporter ExbD [Verrucomicrobiales bacterium]|nr:biopolymer transporter ExbD [Verrucomicrobiales bacterium]